MCEPFCIQAGKAVSGIGKTFLSGAKAAALPAFITSGLGNATRYTLSQGTGRDVSLQEAAENTLMEGALGAGLGGVGNVGKSLLSKWFKLGGSSPTKGRDPALGGDQALSNKTKTSIADASPEAKAAAGEGGQYIVEQTSDRTITKSGFIIDHSIFQDIEHAKKHLVYYDGFTQKDGVKGAHRLDEFKKAEQMHGLIIENDPPFVNGLKTLEYRVAAVSLDGTKLGRPKGGKITLPHRKTVYDPNVHSCVHMQELGLEAAARGYSDGIKTGKRHYNSTAGGIKFRVYINLETKLILDFHPK